MTFPRIYPHLLAVVAFVVVAFLYASPLLLGKRLSQHDSIQAKAAAQEIVTYRQQTGKQAQWTNSMFGGMPAYLITADYPNSVSLHLGRLSVSWLPEPANLLVLLMLGTYLLLLTLRTGPWLAAFGAVATAFCSASLLSIEAGHVSKVIAIAYAPAILAGVILTFRGKYLIGGAVTALALALQLYSNHPQITYYTFLLLGIYGAVALTQAVRARALPQFALAVATLVGAGAVAAGTHAARLLTNYEYSQQTTRGGSALTISPDSTQKAAAPTKGLTREYAFSYSYGIAETFTLLIPSFYGGSSGGGGLGAGSATVKALTNQGMGKAEARTFAAQLPLYWGEQPFVGGPAYAGATVLFLFVLGMFLVKDPIKWWALASTGLCVLLAWGKNFGVVNDLMYDYFPLYNKFRAVTMLLNLAQVPLVVVATLGLREIVQGRVKWENLKKPLWRATAGVGGLCLFFALLGGVFSNFVGDVDARISQQMAQVFQSQPTADQLMASLRDDRASLLRTDALRSLAFVLLTAALLWAFANQKIKTTLLYAALLLAVALDLMGVDKRYLNNDDFKSKTEAAEAAQPTPADQQILRDKDPNFRVFNLTVSPFNDATTSFFHKSVGGYHGAKLGRYQDLIDFQISRNNLAVLNMLNTKYVIAPDEQGQATVQTNPGALGNAWFVRRYQLVPNADAEIKALDKFDPREVAFVDQSFAEQLRGLALMPDSAASIRLTAYAPDQLTYQTNARTEQLAVFSEIYYRGNVDWQATVDGKPAPHLRANYVLRAMRVPAGQHTIVFTFAPPAYVRGETIALGSSVVLVVLLLAAGAVTVRRLRQPRPQSA